MNNQGHNEKAMSKQMKTNRSTERFVEDYNVRPNMTARNSIGGLPPTPPTDPTSVSINRSVRRVKSDGDAGASCGWRTYSQAKQSETYVKSKTSFINPGANAKGYRKVMPQYRSHPQSQRGQKRSARITRQVVELKHASPLKHEPLMRPQVEEQKKDYDPALNCHFMRTQVHDQEHVRPISSHAKKVTVQVKESFDVKAGAVTAQGLNSGGKLRQVVTSRHGIDARTGEYGPAPSQDQIAELYASMLWNGAVDNKIPESLKKNIKTAKDCMQFAENNSPASFVLTDSKYGNSIMPALPRM